MTTDELEIELLSVNARLRRLEEAIKRTATTDSFDDDEYSYERSSAMVRYRNDALVYLVMDDMPGRVADEVAAAIIQAHKTAMRRP